MWLARLVSRAAAEVGAHPLNGPSPLTEQSQGSGSGQPVGGGAWWSHVVPNFMAASKPRGAQPLSGDLRAMSSAKMKISFSRLGQATLACSRLMEDPMLLSPLVPASRCFSHYCQAVAPVTSRLVSFHLPGRIEAPHPLG